MFEKGESLTDVSEKIKSSGDVRSMFSSSSSSHVIATVKLEGSNNNMPWSSSFEMWLMGQGYEDHLVKNTNDIVASERTKWTRIDAQLCNHLCNFVDPKLLNLFQSCITCYKFWTKAKTLYTNDIQCIYEIVK